MEVAKKSELHYHTQMSEMFHISTKGQSKMMQHRELMPDPSIGINVPLDDLEYLLTLNPSSNKGFIHVQEIAEMRIVSTALLEQTLDWIDQAETDKLVEDRINRIYSISPLENKMKMRMLAVGVIFKQQFQYKLGRADFLIHPNRIVEVDGNIHGYRFR